MRLIASGRDLASESGPKAQVMEKAEKGVKEAKVVKAGFKVVLFAVPWTTGPPNVQTRVKLVKVRDGFPTMVKVGFKACAIIVNSKATQSMSVQY